MVILHYLSYILFVVLLLVWIFYLYSLNKAEALRDEYDEPTTVQDLDSINKYENLKY